MSALAAGPLALLALIEGALLVERAVEVAIHRHNTARLARRGAVWLHDDGFRGIVAAQVLLFLATPVEAILAPWAGVGPWTWMGLGALVAAQALRYWCIATLGERWSIRVVTVPGAPRILRGPYRWLAHPNYVAVTIEAAALPLAFGAWASLLVVVPAQLLALRDRIRREEAALDSAEGATAGRA